MDFVIQPTGKPVVNEVGGVGCLPQLLFAPFASFVYLKKCVSRINVRYWVLDRSSFALSLQFLGLQALRFSMTKLVLRDNYTAFIGLSFG